MKLIYATTERSGLTNGQKQLEELISHPAIGRYDALKLWIKSDQIPISGKIAFKLYQVEKSRLQNDYSMLKRVTTLMHRDPAFRGELWDHLLGEEWVSTYVGWPLPPDLEKYLDKSLFDRILQKTAGSWMVKDGRKEVEPGVAEFLLKNVTSQRGFYSDPRALTWTEDLIASIVNDPKASGKANLGS